MPILCKNDTFEETNIGKLIELIGRKEEQERLRKKLFTNKSELVAILGRRRVGKTFLIRDTFKDQFFFQFSGLYKSSVKEHMQRFSIEISEQINDQLPIYPPGTWFDAFDHLRSFIRKSRSRKKKVIFLDEFPWMATNRSRFLTAFTEFWNSFASTRNDLVVIICGSSASWMIKKVLNNKGGLHNRVTDRIFLKPFNLFETEKFLQKKNITINRMGIVQLYMALGGIPFYLDQIDQGESIIQAIDRICFKKGALLKLEFDELFGSLFDHSEKHKTIINLLVKSPQGLTRRTLLKKSKLKSGGGFTSILDELEYSDFISSTIPFGKKKNESIYKLKDFYTLFYHKYILPYAGRQKNIWTKIATSPSWKSWSGLAFENVCFAHLNQINKALKIDGILTTHSTWNKKGDDEMPGSQIDLIIDRADGIINICEIKFTPEDFVLTANYAKRLRLKMASFKHFSKTRKTLFLTTITSHQLIKNKHSIGFVQNQITIDPLFKN